MQTSGAALASRIRSFCLLAGLFASDCYFATGATVLNPADDGISKPVRTRAGLVALYDFKPESGSKVSDASGVKQPAHLNLANPAAVTRTGGSIQITDKTSIRSVNPASAISEAIRWSGRLTVEAWIHPARTDQSGPARILSLSESPSSRNLTLAQDGDRYDVRLRTTRTSVNGLPSLATPSGSLREKLTHVVYTRDRHGRARIYLDGKLSAEALVPGTPANWSDAYPLILGNEASDDRPWLGTLRLVALYNRDLLPAEVEQHFRAGPNGTTPGPSPGPGVAGSDAFFHAEVAPLLSRHCLECHDTATRKGKLDLSRRDSVFAERKNGVVVVAGRPRDSLLWTSVESGAMPDERPPLSEAEKRVLREWIEAGAGWPVEMIDPAAYGRHTAADGNWTRRLTRPEYEATVKASIGVDVTEDVRELLPPDARADGFNNTAYNLQVDLAHVEAYAVLAARIVARVDLDEFIAEFAPAHSLAPENLRQVIARMGKWVLRGPLEDHEAAAYLKVANAVVAQEGGFREAVGYVLEAMLQSPRFLYRVETQRGDGTSWPVGDYEFASRMSYLLWGAPPDRELMRAVEAGELYDRRTIGSQVGRMLRDPRAVERSLQFLVEWMDLDRLDHLRPGASRFPEWDSGLAADMREETLAYFREIVWNQQRPMVDLLNARLTFATPRLAEHYGLEPRGEGLAQYDLSGVPARGGLLTQGSVLTIGGDDASMVTRGLFVLHELLRGTVKDPPPGLDTTPVPPTPGHSQRSIAEGRVANPACGGCHSKFEPLAYALERFDGVGAYRERDEHGNTLREDGEILIPGEAGPTRYRTSAELMDLLANNDRVRETLTWKLVQFAIGRPLAGFDLPLLKRVHESAQAAGGTYTAVMTSIVLSDFVQTLQTEPPP